MTKKPNVTEIKWKALRGNQGLKIALLWTILEGVVGLHCFEMMTIIFESAPILAGI